MMRNIPMKWLMSLCLAAALCSPAFARDVDLDQCTVTKVITVERVERDCSNVQAPTDPPPAVDPEPTALVLTPSGPVASVADGQIIEGLYITADGQPGILVTHQNVTLRNLKIDHKNGRGIDADGAHGLVIEDVSVVRVNPPVGFVPQNDMNIVIRRSDDVKVRRIHTENGSNGLWLWESEAPDVAFHHAVNIRGDYPEGAGIKVRQVTDLRYADFYHFTDRDIGWSSDNVSIRMSERGIVERGLIDGNNNPSGVGVMIEVTPEGGYEVRDVDAIHMGNGSFTASNANNVTWIRTRTRDSSLKSWQDRGYPRSSHAHKSADGKPKWSGASWVSSPASNTNISIIGGEYFNVQPIDGPDPIRNAPNILGGGFAVQKATYAEFDLIENDFTPRDPYIFQPTWSE